MPKITPGNRLYLYRLFSREIGCGRQELIGRFGEVLTRDGILPEDLDCTDVTQLLGELPDLIKLRIFRKGRVYATLLQRPELDEMLARDAQAAEKGAGAAGGARSWRHKKGKGDPKPTKPHHKRSKAQPTDEPLTAGATATTERAANVDKRPMPTDEPAAPTVPAIQDEATDAATTVETSPGAAAISPATSTERRPPISLTITYDPHEGAGTSPQPDLPKRFSTDVHCRDEALRTLYQLLPYGTDVMGVLDEDWTLARSTGTAAGTRGRITFPLRYRDGTGLPLTVTLLRQPRSVSGKRWSLDCMDGNAAMGHAHEAPEAEGTSLADQGAWSDLVTGRTVTPDASPDPVRELASFAILGTWEDFLGPLAAMAEPECWDYPAGGASGNQGTDEGDPYGVLREYVALTFHRIMGQGKLAVADDGSLAAFDTGLVDADAQSILACLVPSGDAVIAWRLAGVCVAGSGDLGVRALALLASPPARASYIEDPSDALPPEEGRPITLDADEIVGHQLGRLPRAFLDSQIGADASDGTLADLERAVSADPGLFDRIGRALDDACAHSLRRVRASWRACTPIYDPTADATKLLVPLCLADKRHADRALVLSRQASGSCLASVILTLPRARTLARVVSGELPSWLVGDAR